MSDDEATKMPKPEDEPTETASEEAPRIDLLARVRQASSEDEAAALLRDSSFISALATENDLAILDLVQKAFRAHGITKKAIAQVTRLAREADGSTSKDKYARDRQGRPCEVISTASGSIWIPLAEGRISIEEERVYNDGVEEERWYRVAGGTLSGQSLPDAFVRATEFGAFSWMSRSWGTSIPIAAGPACRDKLREALETLSNPFIQEVRRHTGWMVDKDGGRAYLHAGGAINGAVVTELEGDLARYALPDPLPRLDPRTQENVCSAVCASFSIMKVAPAEMTPILAMTYAGPLRGLLALDFAPFYVGRTGSFKSEICALGMAHYGPFERKTLPGSWSSTENFLEHQMFRVADALFVIDDYAPQLFNRGTLRAKAERVLRQIGNGSSRGRLTATLDARPARPPRCAVVCTGEEVPEQASLVARLVRVDVRRSDVNVEALTEAQARRGDYPTALRAFIEWVAERFDELQKWMPRQVDHARRLHRSEGAHARQPEAFAALDCTLRVVALFARSTGAIGAREARRSLREWRAALRNLAQRNANEARESEPSRLFISTLATLYAAGRVGLADRKNAAILASDKGSDPIGWRDVGTESDFAFLDPGLAYRAVSRFLAESGTEIGATQRMLARHLFADGFIICPDHATEQRYDCQIVVGQHPTRERRRTWKISMSHMREVVPTHELDLEHYTRLLS